MIAARRTIVIGSIAIALTVLVLANAHLVYAAITSQPECIAHQKPGIGGESGAYSAAQSSC